MVFLMAVGRLRTLCEKLVNMANYPIETPVGIVELAGCPNQRTVVGTMENIATIFLRLGRVGERSLSPMGKITIYSIHGLRGLHNNQT